MVAAQQNAFHGQISNPGNRPLKIQYLLLVRPCFETEKVRLKIAFFLRFVFASKQKTTGPKLDWPGCFLLVRSCFKAEKTPAQNWAVGVFSLGSPLLRSETDSLTEPAKQRYRRFSFGCDSFPIQRNKTQPEPRIFASLFAKLRKPTKRLFLFVRSLFDRVVPSTLRAAVQAFARR